MKNTHGQFDFNEAKLDEQLEQLEQSAYLAGDQPAARTYASLRTFYAPASRHEVRSIERVRQRLAARAAAGAQFHEPAPPMLPSVTEQPTTPLRLPSRREPRTNIWLSTLAALLIAGVLIGSFLTLLNMYSQSAQPPKLTPIPQKNGPWRIVPTPNSPNVSSTLRAITVLSDHDAWAVGSTQQVYPGSNSVFPLFLHWDGKTWKKIQAANTAQQGQLSAMAALGPDNIWAVGDTGSRSGIPHALIEHWNGQQWNVVSSPDQSTSSGFLRGDSLAGISAVAPDDIWAVGDYTSSGNHALVEHWNGSQWSIVSTPAIETEQWLSKVVAVSTNDVWAVGAFGSTLDGSHTSHALVEHWDGRSWQVIASPNPGASSELLTIAATSPTDVWAVGDFTSDGAHHGSALVEHWNGKQWAIVDISNVATRINGTLSAVVALAPDDIWAAGSDIGSALLHWNGQQWQTVPLASPSKDIVGGVELFCFAFNPSSPGALWIAGGYALPGSIGQMLIETDAP